MRLFPSRARSRAHSRAHSRARLAALAGAAALALSSPGVVQSTAGADQRPDPLPVGLSRAAYVDIATLARLLDTLLCEIEADRVEEAKVRAAWASAVRATGT